MNPRKTWEKIAAGSRNLSFDDFVRLLLAFGFEHRRTSGSHWIFTHPRVSRPLCVQPRRGEAKHYQVAQFLAVVEEFGLKLGGDQ